MVIPASSVPSVTCADISITNDTIAEDDEEFLVIFDITFGSNANSGPINTTRVVIVDDDGKLVHKSKGYHVLR